VTPKTVQMTTNKIVDEITQGLSDTTQGPDVSKNMRVTSPNWQGLGGTRNIVDEITQDMGYTKHSVGDITQFLGDTKIHLIFPPLEPNYSVLCWI
jgi:hypothetical protein